MLYVIPTPIGNSDDITLRALKLFQEVDLIITENTGTTKKLLHIHAINYSTKKFIKFTSHDHHSINSILSLFENQDGILVSEAGTPWLSDPGKLLIIKAQEIHIPITILPWATALIPAVIGAQFPTTHRSFYGFLPHKKGREKLLTQMMHGSHGSFFYESVHRIEKLLEQLEKLQFMGKISISRELSKKFEQIITSDLSNIQEFIKNNTLPLKWEFVIWLYPSTAHETEE